MKQGDRVKWWYRGVWEFGVIEFEPDPDEIFSDLRDEYQIRTDGGLAMSIEGFRLTLIRPYKLYAETADGRIHTICIGEFAEMIAARRSVQAASYSNPLGNRNVFPGLCHSTDYYVEVNR